MKQLQNSDEMAGDDMIYEPREDSYLLLEQVKKHAKGKVLDIGTGSGIQARGALETRGVTEVVAVDIQDKVVEHCRRNMDDKRIRFLRSDLFSKVKGEFDTIIFNPPYLPDDPMVKDVTLDGGKKGYEVIERFLTDAPAHLTDEGKILIVFSSLTRKNKIDEIIRKNNLRFEQVCSQKLSFEELYVYLIQKNAHLPKVRGLNHIRAFAEGNRGVLFRSKYLGKECVIKVKRPESKAVGRITNEALWLKRLNKHGIGPRLYKTGDEWFIYEYIEGEFMPEFVEHSSAKKIAGVIKEVFRQCFVLDTLKVDKEEMHHPYKHVIIGKKVVLVDFERAHITMKSKNVTQFCQYIISERFGGLLKKKGFCADKERMISLARAYKDEQTKKRSEAIIKEAVSMQKL